MKSFRATVEGVENQPDFAKRRMRQLAGEKIPECPKCGGAVFHFSIAYIITGTEELTSNPIDFGQPGPKTITKVDKDFYRDPEVHGTLSAVLQCDKCREEIQLIDAGDPTNEYEDMIRLLQPMLDKILKMTERK